MADQAENPYRRFSAALFDEACQRTGLNNSKIADRLRELLGRETLNRQSIGAWRKGTQSVPTDVYLATLLMAGSWNFDVMATTAMRDHATALEVLPITRPSLNELVFWLRALGVVSTAAAEAAIAWSEKHPEK